MYNTLYGNVIDSILLFVSKLNSKVLSKLYFNILNILKFKN